MRFYFTFSISQRIQFPDKTSNAFFYFNHYFSILFPLFLSFSLEDDDDLLLHTIDYIYSIYIFRMTRRKTIIRWTTREKQRIVASVGRSLQNWSRRLEQLNICFKFSNKTHYAATTTSTLTFLHSQTRTEARVWDVGVRRDTRQQRYILTSPTSVDVLMFSWFYLSHSLDLAHTLFPPIIISASSHHTLWQ